MAIICKYKFDSTLCADYLPEFNSEFIDYTKTDVDNGDNTIIRTIEHDTLLPTLIRFGTTGNTTDRERSLLELIECDTANVTNMAYMFGGCTSLTSLDLSNFNTSKVTIMSNMFQNCTSLTSLNLSSFDTSNVTSMRDMFQNCTSLTSLNLSSFDTSKVTDIRGMFYNCNKLTSLDLSSFDTSKVTIMMDMFYNCDKLTSLDLSNFNTIKVTNMYGMFKQCNKLTSLDLSNFNTIKVTDMSYMFNDCTSLTSLNLSNFNTIKVTNMSCMFKDCKSLILLDLSNFDTSKVTDMQSMFHNCSSLTTLNLSNFDTIKVTNMSYMFKDCKSLILLDLSNFDTSNITIMSNMFQNCTSLTSLDLSSFDISKVINISYMFYNCNKLTSLDLSNFIINDTVNTASMFAYTPLLSDIGMVYCTKSTIDKVSSLVGHTCNIYVNFVIPDDCTPVDGITFIFDGYVKTLYLNSPLLEGDTIEEKDGGIYHVHRSELLTYTEGDETSLITDKVNTLHELASPRYELIEQSNLVIPLYANGYLDFDTVVPVKKVEFKSFSEELTYLYANTQYTVQFISDKATTVDIILGGTQLLSQSIVVGLNRISITTPSELADNKLIINGNGIGANISEVVVTNTDKEFRYFEGMKSVGEGGNLVITSSNSDNSLSNTQTLTHAPLRSVGETKDRYVLLNGNWYIERKCGIRTYQEGDKDNYKTDLINTVYPLKMPSYDEIDYNPLEVYSGTTRITTNSTVPTNIIVKNHGFNCLLKPSTTYTISSNLGLNTVTTPSTLTEDCLRFMDTDTSDVTTMKNVLVLEGDWTSKADLIPANFSGIESAFEQELITDENDANYNKYRVTAKVVGKNLFNPDNILLNKYINDSNYNYKITNNSEHVIIVVPVINKDKVVISINSGTFGYARWDDINGNLIKGIVETYRKSYAVLTPPSTNCVLKICISKDGINNNIQIEQGDTVTTYEPYKESNITFYVDEPLRGVGNSKDRIFIKGDKVIVERNCIVKTVNGSENGWTLAKDNGNNITFYLRNNLFADANSDSLCICNLFTRDTTSGLIKVNNSMRITEYSGAQRLFLVPTKEKCSDLQSFKQWLQQNPTTVVYKLAEPVYEEVEYSSNRLILDTFNNESFNNSTLFLDTNISPKLSFKPLWEELVYVKSNTKYYIQFNAVGSGEVVINLGGTELTTEIVEGYNCIPITTPSESTNLMTISGQGITISEVIVSEVICGGYYKGLQSCFEEHMENGKYRVLLRGIALDGSKVNGIKLYINEPLRGIEGIKDRLCIKNGKLMVERKCCGVTFDGSEDERWIIQSSNTTNLCSQYYITVEYGDTGGKNIALNYINDTFKKLGTKYGEKADKEGMYTGWSGLYINIFNSKLSEISNSGIKQWLQANPVSVVYQLATPVYEEATNEYGLPIVFEGYENGIVYIDSAVTPTTHIKYTSNNQLATTLAEAEEQNIVTQEDINMNVITYMMDIDMMLTDMEMSNDISVMAVRRDNSNENMLDRMSDEDKKVYRDNTVVMLEKMITAKVLDKEDIEGRINMYYNKNRISKEQYKYLKSLL